MDLNEITTVPKEPDLKFKIGNEILGFAIVDFWRWSLSDLIENRNRGILAEFIVKQALGLKNQTRLEWDAFDLITSEGIKVEIKSAAYIQAWHQKKYSTISFGIAPTCELLPDNNYSIDKLRKADIYIFCLLHHKDQSTIDPMDLSQWTFYIVTKETLDRKLKLQKSVSLYTIESLEHAKCNFEHLLEKFNLIKEPLLK